MTRRKTPRTEARYRRQDGRILVQDVPLGVSDTQPALPRAAQPGEIGQLQTRLLQDMAFGQLAQDTWLNLFGRDGLQERLDACVQEWRSARAKAQTATQEGASSPLAETVKEKKGG